MGLDCSHDAFHGAYSSFNRLRQEICKAMGGKSSFPPHWKIGADGKNLITANGSLIYDDTRDQEFIYIDDAYPKDKFAGLWEFLMHSDCDGEISPEMCVKVADDLEALLPKIEALNSGDGGGHIARNGGYVAVVRAFIAGCRAAAAANEPLQFG